jgi:hypothetical protein
MQHASAQVSGRWRNSTIVQPSGNKYAEWRVGSSSARHSKNVLFVPYSALAATLALPVWQKRAAQQTPWFCCTIVGSVQQPSRSW